MNDRKTFGRPIRRVLGSRKAWIVAWALCNFGPSLLAQGTFNPTGVAREFPLPGAIAQPVPAVPASTPAPGQAHGFDVVLIHRVGDGWVKGFPTSHHI